MILKDIAPVISLDLGRVDALFMGREDMYLKFLRKFPENVKRLLVELKEAVENNDHQAIEAAAHGIKGVASNLGVGNVTELGTALMLDVRENTPELIAEHYTKLVEEIEKAISYIEKLD
ncbi:MAG: Hpt domain-containing protein [Lachnospiraceae bacterium]|nr:Hpt domain-containing protein [Lachnospiraceae bacterium]